LGVTGELLGTVHRLDLGQGQVGDILSHVRPIAFRG
jgi:hypothetical protein